MALQSSGQISHADIMAEFSEPAGAWRLSQDGGLLLQSVGDPKGPGDEIKESDFYNISAVVPVPSGTFVVRPTQSWWSSEGGIVYNPFYFPAFQYQPDRNTSTPSAHDASGTSTGHSMNIGTGPFFDVTFSNGFTGIQMQQQAGVGAWGSSWLMRDLTLQYVIDVQAAPSPGNYGLAQRTGGRPAIGQSYSAPGASFPTSPNWQKWYNEGTAQGSSGMGVVTLNQQWISGAPNPGWSPNCRSKHIEEHFQQGLSVGQQRTIVYNGLQTPGQFTIQQLATETLTFYTVGEARRGYRVFWRDTYFSLEFA